MTDAEALMAIKTAWEARASGQIGDVAFAALVATALEASGRPLIGGAAANEDAPPTPRNQDL